MNKKIVLPALALAGLTAGYILTASPVQAMGMGGMKFGPGMGMNHDQMITQVAQKLGKSEDEVKAVFTAMHEIREEERFKELEARIDAAISNGQLSADKKQVLLDKMKSLHEDREAYRKANPDATPEQMKAHHDEMHSSLKTWAAEQGIDLSVIMPAKGEGRGPRGGHKGRGGMML